MIIQKLPDNRLFCIRQTTHALLALEFCRHWGNADFASPDPYDAVMLGIAQHDNGWYEWEECPRLDNEGHPVDFLHGPTAAEKRELWLRSVNRTYAQHPYSGLLVALHASQLYEDHSATTPQDERAETAAFLKHLESMPDRVRQLWRDDELYGPALCETRLTANMYLLKFGDNASLQICVPWGEEGVLHNCPVDGAYSYTDIKVTVENPQVGDRQLGLIRFEPWPFGVEEFVVNVHGRLLEQSRFASEQSYQTALKSAPLCRLGWLVSRD